MSAMIGNIKSIAECLADEIMNCAKECAASSRKAFSALTGNADGGFSRVT